MEKTLGTIQKLAKVGKVLSKVVMPLVEASLEIQNK